MKLITALSVYISFLALCAKAVPLDVPLASFKAKFFSIEYQYPLILCNKTASTSESSNFSLAQYLFPSTKSTPTTEEPIKVVSTKKSADKTLVTTPQPIKKGTSCADYFLQGYNLSGLYTIYPPAMYKANPFIVYCDMQTNGGGWTVIQRRDNYEQQENFTRNWNEYKNGFGQLDRDFWLGNDHLFILTNQENVELRVDLEDFEGEKKWAQYSQFRIKDENNSYRLSFSGYKGDAGDSLSYHNNMVFSTYDKDTTNLCANRCKGGWWYNGCWYSNLNGFYFKTKSPNTYQGTGWQTWKGFTYSLKKTEMKIRPTNFLLT